ncbi:hypothetical protein Ndes2526B_g08533 [Nannochloris sp. 'desiccata']
MLAVGSLPMASARPAGCNNGSDCLKSWDEAEYNDYVARYNPFNGTDAAILYTEKEAKAMLQILSSKNASQIIDSTGNSRGSQDKQLSCVFALLGGVLCMYDRTARIRTANCGMYCETFQYKNGLYYGYVKDESSNLPSRADRCCFNHDIALHNRGYPISAGTRAACPIHRAMYNCMVSKNTAWGISIAQKLVSCLRC